MLPADGAERVARVWAHTVGRDLVGDAWGALPTFSDPSDPAVARVRLPRERTRAAAVQWNVTLVETVVEQMAERVQKALLADERLDGRARLQVLERASALWSQTAAPQRGDRRTLFLIRAMDHHAHGIEAGVHAYNATAKLISSVERVALERVNDGRLFRTIQIERDQLEQALRLETLPTVQHTAAHWAHRFGSLLTQILGEELRTATPHRRGPGA